MTIMECEEDHKHRHHRHHRQNEPHPHPRPRSLHECLQEHDFVHLGNGNGQQYTDRQLLCPVDWDPVTDICWPPTPAGVRASMPCPDRPGINPLHNACRQCLHNGSWFVNTLHHNNNHGGQQQPFTNYHDCFVFERQESRQKIISLIGEDTLLIHETFSKPGHTLFWIHGASLILLVIGLLIWISVWRLRRRRRQLQNESREPTKTSGKYKHQSMMTSFLVRVLLQALCVFYIGMELHTTFLVCRVFRVIRTFFQTLFYLVILFYCRNTAMALAGVSFSSRVNGTVKVICVVLLVVVTCLEGWIEIDLHPREFCSFDLYVSPFHWLIIWIQLAMNGASFTLTCVSLFGLFCLKLSQPAKRTYYNDASIMKQNVCLLLFWILFAVILQFSPIFLFHMQRLGYSFDEIIEGTRIHAKLTALSGGLFAILTCALDLEILVFVKSCVHWEQDSPVLRVKVIKADAKHESDRGRLHHVTVVRQ